MTMIAPPIPNRPCFICGQPTSMFQFVHGNACSYEHLMLQPTDTTAAEFAKRDDLAQPVKEMRKS